MIRVRDYFLPMFSQKAISAAPRARSFKTDNTYSYWDLKLVESWATKLEADASEGAYRRDISCEELVARGLEVKLTFQLPHASKGRISQCDLAFLIAAVRQVLPPFSNCDESFLQWSVATKHFSQASFGHIIAPEHIRH